MMSLAQELGSKWLYTLSINDALDNHDVEEVTQFIRSSKDFEGFILNCPPVNEEFGRHLSDAIVQNAHIKRLYLHNDYSEIRETVAWIGSLNTLVNMTSLEHVCVGDYRDMSEQDFSTLSALLLTSTSLHSFKIYFRCNNGCSDNVMSALLSYIGTASLRAFGFFTPRLSEGAFTALCNGVALSTVRHFTLDDRTLENFNLETASESLARLIVESSLEDVWIEGALSTWMESLISALKRTAPVQNMDFTFTHVVDGMPGSRACATRLIINRKWKPLVVSANTPLALWPHILEKSHVFPETSHGSADILFYVLRQKPDLVPAP